MLEYLNSYISPVVSRSIPKYKYYINNLNLFLRDRTKQYIKSANNFSHGMQLIKTMCDVINVPYMETNFTNDIDRYWMYVQHLRKEIADRYDITITGNIYRRYYITGSCTKEYITSIEDINTLKYLPFGQPWSKWKDLDVIKVWWHDSDEFSLNMINNKMKFISDIPNYLLMLVDPIGLSFKWYKFKTEAVDEVPKGHSISQHFIHNYIYPSFLKQLTNMWLLKQFNWLLDITDVKEVSSRQYNDIQVDTQYGKITMTYTDGMLNLWKELEFVRNGTIKATSIMNSRLFLNYTLYDLYLEYTNRWQLSKLDQYEYIRILKDLPLFEILLKLYRLYPVSTQYKNMLREFKLQINMIHNRRPWNLAKNVFIKTYMKNKVNELREKIYN